MSETGIVIIFVILQIVRVFFNRDIHNELHPRARVSLKLKTRTSFFDSVKKQQEKNESDFDFMYLTFIFFWIRIPKTRIGKIKAWSVLMTTFFSILILWRVGLRH